MTTADTLIRIGLDKAKPLLERFGVLGSPLRHMRHARRVLTIERSVDDVEAFLIDPARVPELFVTDAAAELAVPSGHGVVEWRLGARGRARARLRPGPGGATEMTLDVDFRQLTDDGIPRYADNAGVVAIRALHRAKSLLETGEAPTLAVNPAARAVPDPYGD